MKIKKTQVLSTAAAAVLSFSLFSQSIPDAYAAMDSSEFQSGYSYSTEFRDLTAMQLVSDMGVGWNLGNSLESENYEEFWGNPTTTKAMIDEVAAQGITTLRVPVRWDDHYSDPSTYTISSDFMDRVETVVNYGLANDMYVILNVHHCDLQTMVSIDTATQQRVEEELSAIWKQVGARFRDYGDKLIFEVNNEPRDGDDSWTGSAELYNVVNEYNNVAVQAIRATGGNNSKRLLMLPTFAASADAPKVEAWKNLSGDSMVAVSVHAYVPNDFAMNLGDNHTDWTSEDEAVLDSLFSRLYNNFIANGIPVVIGEFGATNKNNLSDRVKFTEYYTALANSFAELRIPCVLWDNGDMEYSLTSGEKYGLFNRSAGKFEYPEIAAAAVEQFGKTPEAETETTGKNVISSVTATASNYQQAVSLDPSYIYTIKNAGGVYVTFSGDCTPQMILQGGAVSGDYSSSTWYDMIMPDTVNGNTAYWSYATLAAAYKDTQYSDYTDLLHIFVGATGGSLTVTEVYVSGGTAHTHSYDGEETITVAPSADTEGRGRICCSQEGCTAYKVVVIPATGAENSGAETDDLPDFDALRRYIMHLTDTAPDNGDIDGNGIVNGADLILLKQKIS